MWDICIFSFSRKWDKVCDEAARQIINTAVEYNVILEFNVNGIRNDFSKNKYWKLENGDLNFRYPRYEFFKLVKEANIPIIINDDAHDPNHLYDEYTKLAFELAEKWGLKVLEKIKID